MSNDDSLSDYLCCPVCFESPEAKVFQCKEGHIICEKCYIKLTKCPECRTPYDPANPIRSRASEAMRDRVAKIDCCFKSNGCQKRFRRNEIETHQAGCHFDIEKFGELINLCKLVGFTQCDFQVNKGNSKEAVEHFISEHNCISTKKRQFKMELLEVKAIKPDYSDSINFWTPIIIDLEKEQCYLLTMALLNRKNNSISWFSIYLPCLKQEGREDDTADRIQLNYAVSNESDLIQPCPNWSSLQSPINLANAEGLLPSQLPWGFNASGLKGYFTRRGSLLITIQCILNGCKAGRSPGKRHRLNRFRCSKKTVTPGTLLVEADSDSWNLEEGSWTGRSILGKIRKDCIEDRRKCLPFLERLFGPNSMANGLSLTDLEWLRKGSLFLTAEVGDVPAIKYLLGKSRFFPTTIKINRVTSNLGNTAIFETIYDRDKELGLHKAQLLVEHGASLQIVTTSGDGDTLLHWAAKNSDVETLKYFSRKGLDINAKNFNDEGPIHFAIYVGWKNMKYLVEEAGVPLETTGFRKRSLLHYATGLGSEATQYFLKKGLNVNGQDDDGLTPLHLAVDNRLKEKEEIVEEIVKILLRNGADKSLKSKTGLIPLNYVNKDYKNVRKLLS